MDDAGSIIPYEKGFNFLWHLEQLVGGPSIFEPFQRKWIDKVRALFSLFEKFVFSLLLLSFDDRFPYFSINFQWPLRATSASSSRRPSPMLKSIGILGSTNQVHTFLFHLLFSPIFLSFLLCFVRVALFDVSCSEGDLAYKNKFDDSLVKAYVDLAQKWLHASEVSSPLFPLI